MSQVKAALPANQLKAFPSVGRKVLYLYAIFSSRPERREAATRVKPVCFLKQSVATGCTNILACGFFVIGKNELFFFQV